MPRNALLNLTTKRHYLPRRYDPFDDMRRSVERMFNEFDRAFASPFFYRPAIQSRSTTLPIESYDSEKGLLKIEVDLSGFKPEDIQVNIKDGQLEISAKSESNGDIKERRELHYSYALSKNADIEKVRSLLKGDGRLVIEAPLPPEEVKKLSEPMETEIPVKKQ